MVNNENTTQPDVKEQVDPINTQEDTINTQEDTSKQNNMTQSNETAQQNKTTQQNNNETQTDNTQSKQDKKNKADMVSVPRETLELIINQNKELLARISRVESAADVGRLDLYDDRQPKKLIPDCKIRMLRHGEYDMPVIGWHSVDDYVGYNAETGRVEVKQTAQYLLLDNNDKIVSVVMDQLVFARVCKLVKCRMVSERIDADGRVIKRLQFSNGREIDVDVIFVN